MRTKLLFSAFVLLAFSLQPLAFSQATAFTYQGRLNANGAPVNGNYDLTFSLFDAGTGGNLLAGPLTNSATSLSNGLFTVTLDFGNQFSGAGRWLEIAARTNSGGAFTTLSPRQQLTPTPYAVQSVNAAAAGSVAASNITGSLTASQLPSGVVTNGASGVSFTGTFSGNGVGLSNLSLALLSGGTINPPLFHGSFSGDGSALTNLNASQLTSGTVPPGVLAGSGVSGHSSFQFGADLAGQDVNAGKIGYEAFSPDSLDIVGAGTTASNRKIRVWAEGGANFTGPVSATSLSGNGSGLTNLNASQLTSGNVGDALLSSNVALRAGGNAFSGNQSVTGGSVGIGITSTNFPLNLGQTLGDKLALYDDGNGQSYGFGITNFGLQIHADTPQADIIFGTGKSTNLSEAMRIKGNGNVGIGNSSPISPLSFANTVGDKISLYSSSSTNSFGFAIAPSELQFHTDTSASDIVFGSGSGTNFTENMRIRGNGYVGIGLAPYYLPATYLVVGPPAIGGGAYCDGNQWYSTSDRNIKKNFAAIDPAEILDQVVSLPIQSWSYKVRPGAKHIGPVAQDFHAAFGLNGADDTHISTVDEGGVVLAAIQGLNQKLEQKETEITDFKARLAHLEELIKLDRDRK
jgi:hypothetical protein